jgi:hypothetical protein
MRGGYRPGSGPRKGTKYKPRQGTEAAAEAEKIKQMLAMGIKAKARFYQEFLVRVANKDGKQKPLSLPEKKLMSQLAIEIAAEAGKGNTESGFTDLEADEFLRKVWNDPKVDMALRIRAAEVAHKENPKGKKKEKDDRAKDAGRGKFAPGRAPISLVK